jgi:hypothetical protein
MSALPDFADLARTIEEVPQKELERRRGVA